MTYTSDVIKKAASKGFVALCGRGKKSVRFYICNKCKEISMFKVQKGKEKWYICRCGYHRQLTKGKGDVNPSLY